MANDGLVRKPTVPTVPTVQRGAEISAPAFGRLLRHWRLARRMSQLTLATEAEISTRHLSFLETGRAQPSREMVLLLASVLEVPLRDRNALLRAAGFAPVYAETPLGDPGLGQVDRALDFILTRQEPYPALVLDSRWNVVRQNPASLRVFSLFLPRPLPSSAGNVMRATFDPEGLRPWIANWETLGAHLVQRLHREAALAVAGDASARLLADVLAYPNVPAAWRKPDASVPAGPYVPLVLRKGEVALSFFTTIATLGTPTDVTLDELRVECFFPADEATERLARGLADT